MAQRIPRRSPAGAGGIPDNVYNKDVLPRWRERFGGASVSER